MIQDMRVLLRTNSWVLVHLLHLLLIHLLLLLHHLLLVWHFLPWVLIIFFPWRHVVWTSCPEIWILAWLAFWSVLECNLLLMLLLVLLLSRRLASSFPLLRVSIYWLFNRLFCFFLRRRNSLFFILSSFLRLFLFWLNLLVWSFITKSLNLLCHLIFLSYLRIFLRLFGSNLA